MPRSRAVIEKRERVHWLLGPLVLGFFPTVLGGAVGKRRKSESCAGHCGAGRPLMGVSMSTAWSKHMGTWHIFQVWNSQKGWNQRIKESYPEAKPVLTQVKVRHVTPVRFAHNKGIHGKVAKWGFGNEGDALSFRFSNLQIYPRATSGSNQIPSLTPSKPAPSPSKCSTSTPIMLTRGLWINFYLGWITVQHNKEHVGY